MKAHILVVDDEKLIRWSLNQRLTKEGHVCKEAADGAEARALLQKEQFDLVLLDLRLPDVDGMTLYRDIQQNTPELPVVMITAYSTVDTAVEALKAGVQDYIAKPFNMDELTLTVDHVLRESQAQHRARHEVDRAKERFGVENIVGEHAATANIKRLVQRIAESDATTVLLLGESGTGKDMIARAIHYESKRVGMPFMNVTCTALPESLLDSELFGYEKGAFTDAREQKRGLFELADGGTVFLDEVGDMSPGLQAKLLHFIEAKTFRRIGGTSDITVDVRIIAATNRDLERAIEQRAFRDDLYYRLSAVPILLPPLRERREDIPLLARHFLREYGREFGRTFDGISGQALQKLTAYAWPGNVR